MLQRKSPHRPALGLDSVLHSDRKHPSDICVASLSSVTSLIYLVAVIFLLLHVCLLKKFTQNYVGTTKTN